MNKTTSDIPELDRAGLKRFAYVFGGGVAVMFGLVLPWLFERAYPLWPWLVLGIVGVWSRIAPMTLRPVYRTWMRIGLIMSRITTPLILGIVFYCVITPVALILRILRYDPLRRKFEKGETYRIEREEIRDDSLEHPY